MLRVMIECTSAMSAFSLAMLRCVRVSRYSFFVFWINVSASGTGDSHGGAAAAAWHGVSGGRCYCQSGQPMRGGSKVICSLSQLQHINNHLNTATCTHNTRANNTS